MPKLMDFLSGLILQDIVCSPLTLTQRTRYDYLTSNQQKIGIFIPVPPHLAVYLELLHARHGGFPCESGHAVICQGQVWNISVNRSRVKAVYDTTGTERSNPGSK